MNPIYRQQSSVSDPKHYASRFAELPKDMASLHQAVNNIFVHMWKMQGVALPSERKGEYCIRPVVDILAHVAAYEDAPYSKQRPREKQYVGDCRHAALLLCSMLRHQGIPARVRHGFCQYISDDGKKFHHHVITELWNGERWVLEDPDIMRHDIPTSEFHFAIDAWQAYRKGEIDPDNYYLHTDLSGWWTIPILMQRDIASLACFEAGSSDCWGLSLPEHEVTDDEKLMLDDAAKMLVEANYSYEASEAVLQKYPSLRPHKPLFVWDWAIDEMREDESFSG
jgi:hypothetical protein